MKNPKIKIIFNPATKPIFINFANYQHLVNPMMQHRPPTQYLSMRECKNPRPSGQGFPILYQASGPAILRNTYTSQLFA
jgi:hypothetical protein